MENIVDFSKSNKYIGILIHRGNLIISNKNTGYVVWMIMQWTFLILQC